jgi:hypothetical protein
MLWSAMPTVLRLGGLRVVVYPNDHRPEHVHVISAEFEAVFRLNCPSGPVALRENYGFARRDIARIVSELQDHVAELCAEWERIHG